MLEPRDLGEVGGLRGPDRQLGARRFVVRRTRKHERVLGVLEHGATRQRELPPRVRGARGHEQDLLVGALAAERQRRIEQRARDALAAGRRIDHAGELHIPPVVRVEPEEAEQPIAAPPQHVIDAVARARAQRPPFELEASAVSRDRARLERRDRVERAWVQPASETDHREAGTMSTSSAQRNGRRASNIAPPARGRRAA